MKLRQLKLEDAPRMLEWMKCPDINGFFRWDGNTISINSVEKFIASANSSQMDRHYAVVNDFDTYMGTISLKSVDLVNRNAEYAVSLHPDAIGAGYATQATTEILRIAFVDLGLKRIYLNVRADNVRAIKFYEKYGFVFEGVFKSCLVKNNQFYDLRWYRLLDDEYSNVIYRRNK